MNCPPPFELPDFYVPIQPRLNPHVEGARHRTKAWARRMGMLTAANGGAGAPLWDERTFDSHDYALLCAYTHPDAAPPELDLITDWYVWFFYFDDHFLGAYKRTLDLDGAQKYLTRLSTFAPLQPGGAAPPADPADPVERGLADLWARTTPTVSTGWRKRFGVSFKALLDESFWELRHRRAGSAPNPIEYIEKRRKMGGAVVAAHLVEHAVGSEVPELLAATRQFATLADAFADAVHLCNDIFSYAKEIGAEGEQANAIVVASRFLDINVQAASDFIGDQLAGRMHQFENTALLEVPPLIEEHQLGVLACQCIFRYIRGLQDYMAGCLEWHKRSGRYVEAPTNEARTPGLPYIGPTGFFTALAPFLELPRGPKYPGRIKTPEEVKEDTTLDYEMPTFYMPYPAQLNPHADSARDECRVWAAEMGMFTEGVWDAGTYDRYDFPGCVAYANPGASAERLRMLMDWNVWLWYFDDFVVEAFKRHRKLGPADLRAAHVIIERLWEQMPEGPAVPPPPTNVSERALGDIWRRTKPLMSPAWQARFRRNLQDHVRSTMLELINIAQDRIVDPIEFVEMRRLTVGGAPTMDLIGFGAEVDLPPAAFDLVPVRDWRNCFTDAMGLASDVLTYRKERLFEGDINNGVLVMQRFFDCRLQRAVNIVNDLVTARMEQFERIIEEDFDEVFDTLQLDETGRAEFRKCIDAVRLWLSGVLFWQDKKTSRYKATPSADRGERELSAMLRSRALAWSDARPAAFVPVPVASASPIPEGAGPLLATLALSPANSSPLLPAVPGLPAALLALLRDTSKGASGAPGVAAELSGRTRLSGLGTSAARLGLVAPKERQPASPRLAPLGTLTHRKPTGLGTSGLSLVLSPEISQEIKG